MEKKVVQSGWQNSQTCCANSIRSIEISNHYACYASRWTRWRNILFRSFHTLISLASLKLSTLYDQPLFVCHITWYNRSPNLVNPSPKCDFGRSLLRKTLPVVTSTSLTVERPFNPVDSQKIGLHGPPSVHLSSYSRPCVNASTSCGNSAITSYVYNVGWPMFDFLAAVAKPATPDRLMPRTRKNVNINNVLCKEKNWKEFSDFNK